MYCPRCGVPNLSGDVCVDCLTDKEYREVYGKERVTKSESDRVIESPANT